MIDLSRLLSMLLRDNSGNVELAVHLAWSRVAGKGLRRHVVPGAFDGNNLTVSVADAIWQKQLQQMSAELIFRMNMLLGKKVVQSLGFQIDPASVSRAQGAYPTREEEKRRPAKAPTELLFAAGAIADEELRARFIRAAENCIARRDARE